MRRWIAYALNHIKRTCWADLVEYGSGDYPGYRTLRWAVRHNRACERDAVNVGTCYCGKVATAAFVAAHPGIVCPRRMLEQEDVRRIASSPEVEP